AQRWIVLDPPRGKKFSISSLRDVSGGVGGHMKKIFSIVFAWAALSITACGATPDTSTQKRAASYATRTDALTAPIDNECDEYCSCGECQDWCQDDGGWWCCTCVFGVSPD